MGLARQRRRAAPRAICARRSPRPIRTSAPPSVRPSAGSADSGARTRPRSPSTACSPVSPTASASPPTRELEVTALAARDERRAAEFVATTLGPLAADDPNAARLRETLRVFLDEAEHAPRAAARLHTHRNTVLQRVARATELLGHRPGDRRLALELALELAHRLGPRVMVT